MRPAEVLYAASARLSDVGNDQASADARLLLAHVLDVEPRELLTLEDVSDDDRERLDALVDQRLAGMPTQYITGKAAFRYLEVEVGPGVLIPRPETEQMTGWAIDWLKQRDSRVVVELCSGSGAIAKAIATEVDDARVYANELEPDAYEFTVRNLASTGVELDRGDMAYAFTALDGTVDLVIANPPYITEEAYESLPDVVKDAEPSSALVSGPEGLDDIQMLVYIATRLLKPGGVAVIEHGDDQGESAPELFRADPAFGDVSDHTDLNDRPRFLVATRVPDPPTWRRFAVGTDETDDEALAAAVEAVRAGQCVVLPTDTVYGIGADALNADAVRGLLNAKRRGRDMPPPVLIAEPAMLPALAKDIPDAAQALADAYWPGPLTLILEAQPGSRMDLGDTDGSIAVRVPDHDAARALLRRTGPLAVSSANVSGQPSSTTIDAAIDQLGNDVAVYLDAGPTPGSVASTIVDFVGADGGRILREGVIGWEQIHEHAPDLAPRAEESVEPVEPAAEQVN